MVTPCVALVEQRFVHGWAGGALFGGAVVAGVASMMYVVTLVSGSASTTMGAQAEEWTASTLRKYERRGAKSFDNIGFYDGDVDHVFVGNGMVLAIETKWSGRGCNSGPKVIDGVHAMDGNDFSKWFATMEGDTEQQQLERVIAGLDEFVDGRRAHERRLTAARKVG